MDDSLGASSEGSRLWASLCRGRTAYPVNTGMVPFVNVPGSLCVCLSWGVSSDSPQDSEHGGAEGSQWEQQGWGGAPRLGFLSSPCSTLMPVRVSGQEPSVCASACA